MAQPHLLIVDDQVEISTYIRHVAEDLGYAVTVTNDSTQFMKFYNAVKPSTVVLDIFMPERDGIELMCSLAKAKSDARILFISGSDEFFLTSTIRLAQDFGLTDVRMMKKPLNHNELKRFLSEKAIAPVQDSASVIESLRG